MTKELAVEAQHLLAGMISTSTPFAHLHPSAAVPIACQIYDAIVAGKIPALGLVTKWVKVPDAMPETGEWLCLMRPDMGGAQYMICYFEPGVPKHEDFWRKWVYAWQPLPTFEGGPKDGAQ